MGLMQIARKTQTLNPKTLNLRAKLFIINPSREEEIVTLLLHKSNKRIPQLA
jgi:hypothetical protein